MERMMSKLSTARTVALALGMSAAAVAVEPARADMPPIWTGFYAGAHGGYGEALDEPAPFDVSGGVLGLHAGYNHQAGMFVIGVEGDWSGSNIEDSQTAGGIRVTLHVDDLASIRARLGVVAWQNALLYGTVGYAWGEAGTNVNFAGLSFGRSTDFDGLVAGGGIDYRFAPDWSLRVEGLRYWLEPDTNNPNVDDLDAAVVRAGVTWHLPR
jgi:outer membrane immunogenic protein